MNTVLKGSGVADDVVQETTIDWLKNLKSMPKTTAKTAPIVKKRKYGENELKGLKIAHSVDDFNQDQETILVLKDATISELEEQGDQLESIAIAESHKLRQNLENKSKKSGYTAYDDEDFTGTSKRGLLNKYDEEINGVSKPEFILGQEINLKQESNEKPSDAMNLDVQKSLISDYYTTQEMVAFKKPKKKKRPKARVREEDDEQIDNSLHIDGAPPSPAGFMDYQNSNIKADIASINFIDDDDLQASLARSRKFASRKKFVEDIEDGLLI